MLNYIRLMLEDHEFFKENIGDFASATFLICCGFAIFMFVSVLSISLFF